MIPADDLCRNHSVRQPAQCADHLAGKGHQDHPGAGRRRQGQAGLVQLCFGRRRLGHASERREAAPERRLRSGARAVPGRSGSADRGDRPAAWISISARSTRRCPISAKASCSRWSNSAKRAAAAAGRADHARGRLQGCRLPDLDRPARARARPRARSSTSCTPRRRRRWRCRRRGSSSERPASSR